MFSYHLRLLVRGEYSLGLGSVSKDDSDSMTLNKDRAGLHMVFRMSRQMCPESEMFIWYILECMQI